jgi:tetratricopeptide (TPR) repeat protein
MEAAIALAPENRSLLLATAVSERQAGHLDKAIDLLSKSDDSAEAKELLGGLLEKQGRHAESIKAYRDAARLDPGRETVRVELGRELIALGAFDQANTELLDSLRKFPESAPLLTLFGILEYSGGQPERAREILSQAIRADSKYQPAYILLARMAVESTSTPGKEEMAIVCAWDAITCSALELRVARDTSDKQLEERSMAVLRAASPDNGTAACALGQAYAWDGRPEQARPKLERCVRLDPTPQNHYRLAQVYRKLGASDLAQAQLAARSELLKNLSDQTAKAADSLKALETKIK